MTASLETLRPQINAILERAIAARAFPGCVVHLEWRGQVLVVAHGQRGYEAPFAAPVSERTVYDLASLTKLWTLAAALLSLRQRRIRPDAPLFVLLPQFDAPGLRAITLRHLMMHASGISFAIQSLVHASTPAPHREWIARIAAEPLATEPGTSVLYSCTNYFLLARALDMDAFESPLKALISDGRYFHAPNSSLTLHPAGLPSRLIAPTEAQPDGAFLRGIVHDEAARFWSSGKYFSFAGNAGLFGDVAAVAGFVRLWLRDGTFFPGDIERALSDTLPEGEDGARRGWGWQIDSPMLCGKMGHDAPLGAFGHSGFTGPTLWAHRATQSACIILNNRVHPTRNGPNRLPFHREISALLGGFLRQHDAGNFESPL